jgi:hypothetical protein
VTYECDGIVRRGRARDGGGRASNVREIDPFKWRHYKTVKGGLIEEHTAVVLERVLANFDGVLTVFIGDAARTTDSSGFLWLEIRRCGEKTGGKGTFKPRVYVNEH